MGSVAMLIRTSSLRYDDRLRKECLSIEREGDTARILVVERDNEAKRGTTEYGVSYRSFALRVRRFFNSGSGLGLKVAEMYLRMLPELFSERTNTVWAHNIDFLALIPVLLFLRLTGVIDQIVWDQHELPPEGVLEHDLLQNIYRWANYACDQVIVANDARREYLVSRGLAPSDTLVLNNYPDEVFAEQTIKVLPDEVSTWLDGEEYILAQGGANPRRYLENLVAAFVEADLPYRLLIVGPYREVVYKNLVRKWGEAMHEAVRFTGAVPQMDLTRYIDHAAASIILYSTEIPNEKLCAPNRLYQAISRGCPVIVGSNPPMRHLVEEVECGVVLSADGRDQVDIIDGIEQFRAGCGKYARNAESCNRSFLWEKQQTKIFKLIYKA